MTRDELKKKRKEFAEQNGYKGYVPKSVREGTRQKQEVRNPEPVQEKKSTWSNVIQRIGNTMDYISGGHMQEKFNKNTVRNDFRNPNNEQQKNKSLQEDVRGQAKIVGQAVKGSGLKILNYIENATENNFSSYREREKRLGEAEFIKEQEKKGQPVISVLDKGERKIIGASATPTKDKFNKAIDETEAKIQKETEKQNNPVTRKFSELLPSITQSVVGMGVSAVNPALGIEFWQTSAGGDYIRQAEQKGLQGKQALAYGTIMGALESGTEWIGGELTKGVGKGAKGLLEATGKKEIKSQALKALGSYGLDIGENFFEEAIMEPLEEVVTQATGGKADWSNIKGRMIQSGIDGALTSIIMGGASAGIGSAVGVMTKAENGEQISQEDIKKALTDINKSEEVDIEKLLVDNFNFNPEDFVDIKEVNQARDAKMEQVASEMTNDERKNIINGSDLDDRQKETLSEIAEKYQLSAEDIQKAIDKTKNGEYAQNQATTSQNNEVSNQNKQTTNQDTQNEITTNLMRSIDNYNNSRQEGEKIFDINDENTRKEVESIQKIAEKRGVNITFDESRFDSSDTNAFYEYDEDGNVANIILNPNSTSKKYVENLAIHEMTHSFEGSKEYDRLSRAVLDYAKRTGEYDKAFEDLKATYEKVYGNSANLDSIVEKEAVANILGEKLGDQEFVNDLVNGTYSTENKTLVQKIYDFVKNQINRFKGYKDQEQYWTHIKELFDDAMNKSEISQEGLKASKEATAMTNITDSQGRNLSQGQVDYFKDSKIRDESGNLIPMYHSTNADFTVFDKSKLGDNTAYGNTSFGFFVTSNKAFSERFQDIDNEGKQGKTMEVYIDSKKPIVHPYNASYKYSGEELDRITREWLEATDEAEGIEQLEEMVAEGESESLYDAYMEMTFADDPYVIAEQERQILESKGYDAVEFVEGLENTVIEGSTSDNPVSSYAVFNSNQIKNVDNVNPTESQDIRYSKETSTTDSQGRTLSKQQQEYFKDSKVRDENGNLIPMYHGTPAEDFNIFDKNKIGSNTGNYGFFGDGFYFTQLSEEAKHYGKNVKEVYINITNPFNIQEITDLSQYIEVSNLVNLNNEWGKIYTNWKESSTWQDIANDVKKLKAQGLSNSEIDSVLYDKYGELPQSNYTADGVLDRLYTESKKNNYLTLSEFLKTQNYDGIITGDISNKNTDTIAFESNQIKNIDNTNPTTNLDIRYSQDTTGAWNNFIEKYFKNEGTGTAIKDMKKLPTKQYTIQDFEEVINNSANIPETDKADIMKDLETIEFNKESLDWFKDYVEQLDTGYKEYAQEQEKQRFNQKNYKDEGRAELISKKRKEFNKNMKYDDSVIAELDEIIPRNRNGKRTVQQWKNMAKQIGQRIADLSPEKIEDIAVKSYYDLEPTKAITRYDNVNKTNMGFEQLYANDWINAVYEGVRENRQFSMETENTAENAENVAENKTEEIPKRVELPKVQEEVEEVDENLQAIRDNSLLNKEKEGKSRKHYKTYSQTDTLSVKDRNQAKKLYKDEVYVPISNNKTLDNANKRIKNFDGGIDALYDDYNYRISTGEEMSLTDIATMERMIQLYSEKQDHKKVNELMQNVAILGTELGQKVQALSIIKRTTPEGQLRTLQRLVQRVNARENTGIQLTDEQVERILATNNPKEAEKVVTQIAEELGQSTYAKFGDRARAWRYLSMLGNPRTHIRNIFGNVAMDLVQQVKNKGAGLGQDVVSIFKPGLERTATFRFANKEQKEFAKEDAKLMKGAIDNNGVIDVEKIFEQSKKTSKSKALNAIENFNSNLLEAEDDMFLNIAYKQAMQGYMASNKLTKKDMQDAKTLNKARQYAIQQAKEATFHQFSSLARQLNAIEKLGDATGLITAGTVPFKKTPINIAKTGVAYSPLGIARAVGGTINDITSNKNKLQEQLKNGDLTQEEYKTEISNMVNNRIDQMAKGLTGTGIAMLGYALAKSGIISGANDDDEDEFDTKLGKQELSLRIGDNTYSLDWLAPTAIPLFVGANIANTVYDSEDESALNATLTSLANIVSPMTEMSMLQGLASALSSYEQDSANKLGDIATSALTSYAGQYVPTALGQVAKTIDPVVRDTSSTKKGIEGKLDRFKNQQLAKIPGASQMLPSKSDIWGEEKKRADNPIQRFLENAVLPYNREKIIEDMTSEELKNVFNTTGEKGVLPSTPQKSFTIDKQKYNLTSKEYNQAKKIYGQTAKKMLDKVIVSNEFNSLDNDVKVDLIKDIYTYSKGKIKEEYTKEHKIEGYDPRGSLSKKKYNALKTYMENNNLSELLKIYTEK